MVTKSFGSNIFALYNIAKEEVELIINRLLGQNLYQ